jgi:hypothetical protein
MVKLQRHDHEYIWGMVYRCGLGAEGFDQALRQIIREHRQANEGKTEEPEQQFLHPPFP